MLQRFHKPFMHPGKRASFSFSKFSGEIHFPKTPVTPGFGVGIVSFLFSDAITVLLSTLATSAGSVQANQLEKEH